MAELRFSFEVPADPTAVIGALTDFTPRRPELWPDLDPEVYEVLELGGTSALVREGQRTPRLWAVEAYDWSRPGSVTWRVRESNFCVPGSSVTVAVEPAVGGGSRLDVTWDRNGSTWKGKAIVALVRLSRGRPLAKSYATALSRLASGRPSAGERPIRRVSAPGRRTL